MARINVYSYDEYEGKKLAGWFDSDSAEWIREDTYWDGNNHRGVMSGLQCGYEGIYRTKGGRWVRHYDARNEYNGPNLYEFLTDEQAREWLLKNKSDDVAERYFGPVEEERGPGRPEVGPPINTRVSQELLDMIDGEAQIAGVSRAEMIRRLLTAAASAQRASR